MDMLTDVAGRMAFHRVAAQGFSKVSKSIRKKGARVIINTNNESTLKHIFRNKPGHLKDTHANRNLLERIASNPRSKLG